MITATTAFMVIRLVTRAAGPRQQTTATAAQRPSSVSHQSNEEFGVAGLVLVGVGSLGGSD